MAFADIAMDATAVTAIKIKIGTLITTTTSRCAAAGGSPTAVAAVNDTVRIVTTVITSTGTAERFHVFACRILGERRAGVTGP